MRIAVLKPDYLVVGGFEVLVDVLLDHLRLAGHDIVLLTEPYYTPAEDHLAIRGVPVSPGPDVTFLNHYVQCALGFRETRITNVDLVISTQPPSFHSRQPRHLSLFYHHLRQYYDLADLTIRGQLAPADRHQELSTFVRNFDAEALGAVTHFLCGSPAVQRRLAATNGLTNSSVFLAGLSHPAARIPAKRQAGHVLCVSRHEFPKRTELVVQAASGLDDFGVVLAGTGGRMGQVQDLASKLALLGAAALDHSAESLWLCPPEYRPGEEALIGNCNFRGFVDDDELERLYAEALCVVAPAYDEDYGLTAIEAMAHGKPLIVCSDGGNLVEFVEHGTTGYIVEPNGRAIAEAVNRLRRDPALACSLGEAGRQRASEYTWERALKQLDEAISVVMDS